LKQQELQETAEAREKAAEVREYGPQTLEYINQLFLTLPSAGTD
jgi:hypothetical protein